MLEIGVDEKIKVDTLEPGEKPREHGVAKSVKVNKRKVIDMEMITIVEYQFEYHEQYIRVVLFKVCIKRKN